MRNLVLPMNFNVTIVIKVTNVRTYQIVSLLYFLHRESTCLNDETRNISATSDTEKSNDIGPILSHINKQIVGRRRFVDLKSNA